MDMQDGTREAQASGEDNPPDKVVILRTYTKVYNDYYDALFGVVSPTAYYILHWFVRRTHGFHRDSVKATITEITDATRLSRNTVITGIRELKALHIMTSDGEDRGRTQVRTYHMESFDTWTLPTSDTPPTSANFELVSHDTPPTSANFAPVEAPTSAENAPVATQTSANFAPHEIKEDIKQNTNRNENEDDAHASVVAPARRTSHRTPSTPSTTSSKQSSSKQSSKASTKLATPEAREAHNREAAYVTDLTKRQLSAIRCGKSPKVGEDRAGGHWFYTAGENGAPAEPDDVMALYAVVKHSPHYSGQYLTIQAITRYWPDWQADPQRVRESIATEQRRADYARSAASNGGRSNGNGRSTYSTAPAIAPASEPGADDALTRKGQETRERLRRLREQDSIAPKGETL